MGFFSQGNYGTVNYLENVQIDPSYCDNNGIYRSLVEGYENDRIMFEHMLEYDFKESSLIHEGAGSEEIMALQENVFTSFFNKIKELFKKIWAKIKAVFHGFIAKFSAKFGSDNKAFAKKYRKEIFGKNLSKFEAKYEKPKNIESFISLSQAKAYNIEVPSNQSLQQLKSLVEDWDEEDEEEEVLKTLSGCPDVDSVKDFNKTIHEWCFEDKETIEGPNDVETALNHLEKSDKTIKKKKKASDKIQRAIEDCIKKIDKMVKDYYKNMKYDDDTEKYSGAGDISMRVSYDISKGTKATLDGKDIGSSDSDSSGNAKNISKKSKEYAQNIINLLSKKANVCKNAFNKVSAACLKEAKFYIAQDRMLVAKAVAYRPKNESTELVSQGEMDFFGDIAAWEVETDLR